MTRQTSAYAPASIANLSVGFDMLGMAIRRCDGKSFGDRLTVTESVSGQWRLEATGPYADRLPRDPEENLVVQAWRRVARRVQQETDELPPIHVQLDKGLPIGSGLGSSASSIVASVMAFNDWYGQPLEPEQLLAEMVALEATISGSAHLDNVAPCYVGGLVMCHPTSQQWMPLKGWPDHWKLAVAYPSRTVATSQSRQALPDSYSRDDLLGQSASLAFFVSALREGQWSLAAEQMVDVVAEPYRQHLLPGYTNAKKYLMEKGALAVGISGSGPTLFAVVDHDQVAQSALDWLRRHYASDGFAVLCEPAYPGAHLLEPDA